MKRIERLSDRSIMLLMYAVLAVASILCARRLTLPLVDDEVGIMANTAFLAGKSWSLSVHEIGDLYFKAALSIIYYPLYVLLCSKPFLMYSVMNGLDLLLISFVPVIAYHISRKYLRVESKAISMLMAAASFISPIWLHATYARADVLLIVAPWLLLLLLLQLGRASREKDRIVGSVLVSLVMALAYMAHTRGIVFCIALVMTVCIVSMVRKRRIVHGRAFVISACLFFAIESAISSYIKNGVHGMFPIATNTIETFDFSYYLKLLTADGIEALVKLIGGWTFNLMTSSYGLFAVGMIAALVIGVRTIRQRDTTNEEFLTALFFLLCMLGAFAMGILFFYRYAYQIISGIEVIRVDRILYGRYTVCAAGPICMLAIYTLACRREWFSRRMKALAVLLYAATAVGFFVGVCPHLVEQYGNIRYFISLTTFFDISEGTRWISQENLGALMKSSALGFAVMLMILCMVRENRKRLTALGLSVVILLSCANSAIVFSRVRDRDDEMTAVIANVTTFVNSLEGIDAISAEYPVMPYDNGGVGVQQAQASFPRFNVGTMHRLEGIEQTEFLTLTVQGEIETCMEEMDGQFGKAAYYLFDDYVCSDERWEHIVLIRGENLAELIRSYGHALREIKAIE